MFTIEQIQEAHSKVKSGADFPAYIQEFKTLGVTRYETYVTDGHTDYFGEKGYTAIAPAKYAALNIAEMSDMNQFTNDLKAHQQGKTDYPTFCRDAANAGVEKWLVCMDEMTCTYVDKGGTLLLMEVIPR
ncbi:DUF1398 domain-containing protein [Crocinitomicaceae bacterium CZZ-1]|uniref:DUF1398 domain-containing protein n=1 Tax=Taishania pollutisoli TaxID=2766479 RepID=A0A8J6P5C4_9FLAO|nr:DUF1398 family protein [Taishania pollutisoli]MBC9812092.1 DUF1398 domain-containing protein [Taishania pollutisoli]MBX2949833.1 DUF1398 domain-containing protein [Crocinitomicaceae bacterium]NGF74752.1 DUF1398 domain-containing protein [Fluviicola sp. SGL-29]